MKIDMSPEAVTKRLNQTGELRRLCLSLGKNSFLSQRKRVLKSGQNRSEEHGQGASVQE
jgi:hypothetical protein